MASANTEGVAERYIYKPVLSLFSRMVRRLSLGTMLVVFTLPAFPLLNTYGYLFIAGLETRPMNEVFGPELDACWPSFGFIIAVYVLLGGGLVRLGIPSIVRPLRLLENPLRRLGTDFAAEELRQLLVYLNTVPVGMMRLALAVYFVQEIWFYAASYLARHDFTQVRFFLLIDFFLAVILSGLVYSITEFSCGYLRVQVKHLLSAYDETGSDIAPGRPGIYRFAYLLFVGATSTVALIVFLQNRSEHVIWQAVGFSAITFLICGTLAFIYFYTWTYSLRQISEATYSVAMGGRGHLPILSNDRELVELAANFDAATYEINTIRNYLTELVDEKTKTLSDAYEELKQLKSRQDGDYYLTSNLIESLTEMRPESDSVVIDSLIKQYKTFEFMGHTKEIGGDMNAGYSIRLQGEKYTLVVNADAMGKSLQGAGGVLVLGSALRSLIERTQINQGIRNQSPERWLKNAFLELHRLFSSFNGGMMASMICLLIHDSSGYTVMINAEHPKGILLRRAQSTFISHHEGLRKLGNTAVKGRLWVDTFMMQHGDIVILGSDGRDDLIVGHDDDGQPVMNEDERRILRIVRAADGDLPRIFLGIRASGEIVDDVSLLRVQYSGRKTDPQAALTELWNQHGAARDAQQRIAILRKILQSDAENLGAWQALFRIYLGSKNFVEGAFITECLLRLRPDRDFFMYSAALLFYKIGNYEKAFNYADRLALRNWRFAPYLVLLGLIHEARQDAEGMREAGLLLTELNPQHEYGMRLMDTQPGKA